VPSVIIPNICNLRKRLNSFECLSDIVRITEANPIVIKPEDELRL
jgi:hypothetical protein